MGYSLCVRACVQGLGHDRARLEEGWCQSSGGARGNGLGGEFRTYGPAMTLKHIEAPCQLSFELKHPASMSGLMNSLGMTTNCCVDLRAS